MSMEGRKYRVVRKVVGKDEGREDWIIKEMKIRSQREDESCGVKSLKIDRLNL